MNAIRKFRRNHPVLFSLAAILACNVILMFVIGPIYYGTVADFFDGSSRMRTGMGSIVCDASLAILCAIILALTGRAAVIARKGQGFFKGLSVPGLVLCFEVVGILCMSCAGSLGGQEEVPQEYAEAMKMFENMSFDSGSVVVIIGFLMVGVGEEFLCRGIVGQTLLERFGTSRGGIWKAVVISSVFFALMHSINIFSGGDLIPISVQAANAFFSGMFLACVYFRTGNIWVVALVHGLNDIMASSSIWLYSGEGVISELNSTSAVGVEAGLGMVVVMGLFYTCLSLFLLRKSKIGEVEKNWQPELAEWRGEKDAA